MPPRRQGAEPRDFPWWLVAFATLCVGLAAVIAFNDLYAQVFGVVAKGIGITIGVTLAAFTLATALGLAIALAGLSNSVVLRQIARFYVELIRGIPILVLLFYIAFVARRLLSLSITGRWRRLSSVVG